MSALPAAYRSLLPLATSGRMLGERKTAGPIATWRTGPPRGPGWTAKLHADWMLVCSDSASPGRCCKAHVYDSRASGTIRLLVGEAAMPWVATVLRAAAAIADREEASGAGDDCGEPDDPRAGGPPAADPAHGHVAKPRGVRQARPAAVAVASGAGSSHRAARPVATADIVGALRSAGRPAPASGGAVRVARPGP